MLPWIWGGCGVFFLVGSLVICDKKYNGDVLDFTNILLDSNLLQYYIYVQFFDFDMPIIDVSNIKTCIKN
jgi:hypothetical protein